MHNKIKLLRPDLILSKKLGMEKKSASAAHNCVYVSRHLDATPPVDKYSSLQTVAR